jgi:hypothetical protein
MVKRGAWRGAIVARSGARRAGEGGPAIGEGERESLRENEEDGKEHGTVDRRAPRPDRPNGRPAWVLAGHRPPANFVCGVDELPSSP